MEAEEKDPRKFKHDVIMAVRNLTFNEVDDIKLQLETQGHLKESQIAKIYTAKELATELFRLKKISLEDPSLLADLLRGVGRDDIADIIQPRVGMKHCFVISNDQFVNDGRILGYRAGQDANLPGYIPDTKLVCDTFEQLGFEVKLERNQSAENMKSIVQRWSDGDFSMSECIMFVLLTHGGEHGIVYANFFTVHRR